MVDREADICGSTSTQRRRARECDEAAFCSTPRICLPDTRRAGTRLLLDIKALIAEVRCLTLLARIRDADGSLAGRERRCAPAARATPGRRRRSPDVVGRIHLSSPASAGVRIELGQRADEGRVAPEEKTGNALDAGQTVGGGDAGEDFEDPNLVAGARRRRRVEPGRHRGRQRTEVRRHGEAVADDHERLPAVRHQVEGRAGAGRSSDQARSE